MGMNTTDVRDTPHDQTIFWTAAIPVTAGVVALSFIYGYKGDAIEDFVSRAFWSMAPGKKKRRQRLIERQNQENSSGVLKQVSFKEDDSGHLPIWMHLGHRRKKGKINRRATNDTFFSV